MKKQKKADQYYAMQCYRYAPEQFKAYRITGFSNGNRNIPLYEEIKLSYDESWRCGNAMLCKGRDAALAELKRILRARIRSQKQYYTIGFYSKTGHDYVFIRALRFEKHNLKAAYQAYKELKKRLAEDGWRVKQTTTVKLDGRYKPIPESVEDGYLEIDSKRPLFIRFASKEAA